MFSKIILYFFLVFSSAISFKIKDTKTFISYFSSLKTAFVKIAAIFVKNSLKKSLNFFKKSSNLFQYVFLSEKNIIGTSVYSSSKSFLDKFVKNISLENIKYNITANTIQLGYFDGGMTYEIPKNIIENIKNRFS